MGGCGYTCPACGGNQFLDDGTPCDWCTPLIQLSDSNQIDAQELDEPKESKDLED